MAGFALTKVRESIRSARADQARHAAKLAELGALPDSRVLTPAEEADYRSAADGKRAADELLEGLREREVELLEAGEREDRAARSRVQTGGGHVTREQRTYAPAEHGGDASFFRDAYATASGSGDVEARTRIERSQNEARADGLQTRAVATSGYAGLVVPQYLVDLAAIQSRAGRTLANLSTRLPLPDQGMTFQIPRGTTGASTAVQAAENTAVSSTDEVWANLTLTVTTIAGQQDVSRQSIERGTPGLDQLIYLDLASAYAASLDAQVISGTGATGQVLGILNTAGINAATAFGAVPAAANFTTKLAGAIQAINAAGAIAAGANAIVVHPRRWGWLCSLSDSTGRPLVVPVVQGPYNAVGIDAPSGYSTGSNTSTDAVPVGFLQGMPVFTSLSIPTTVGTNSEDVVLIMNTRHSLLFEDGDGLPRQLRFDQTLGNQLTVKLVTYGYIAYSAGRYPTAFSKVGGLDSTATFGLVAPTF